MKAVILVGGEGMRLRPLTCTTPKPMLPLVNTPFIEHTISHLRRYGVDEVILSAGYLPTAFDDHLGDGKHLGVKITYVVEKKPLGTCGAVKNVEKHLDDTFLVMNGDILTDVNLDQLIEFHRTKGAVATINLTSVENPTQYGLVNMDMTGRVTGFLEKPSWDEVTTDLINAGTYVLEPSVLRQVPTDENVSFERQVFPMLIEQDEPVVGFASSCYWIDIGTPEKYLQAHRDYMEGRVWLDVDGTELKKNVWAGKGTEVSDEAVVFGPVIMGNNVSVAANATIFNNTVLGDDVKIGVGARLEGCVLFNGAEVSEGAVVKNSILGKGVKVGKKVHVDEVAVLGDNTQIQEDNVLKRGIKLWPDTSVGKSQIRF